VPMGMCITDEMKWQVCVFIRFFFSLKNWLDKKGAVLNVSGS